MLTNNSYFFNHLLPFLGGLVSSGHEPNMSPRDVSGISKKDIFRHLPTWPQHVPAGCLRDIQKRHLSDIFRHDPNMSPRDVSGISKKDIPGISRLEKYSCFIFECPVRDIPRTFQGCLKRSCVPVGPPPIFSAFFSVFWLLEPKFVSCSSGPVHILPSEIKKPLRNVEVSRGHYFLRNYESSTHTPPQCHLTYNV